MANSKRIDEKIGRKYGRVTVLSFVKRAGTQYFYFCRCDCGTEREFRIAPLMLGTTKSCGCFNRQRSSEVHKGNTNVRKPHGVAAMNHLFSRYKRGAIDRGLSFEISTDQFKEITSKPCFYCGSPPRQVSGDGARKNCNGVYIYNGIDRADNSVGYLFGNCVPCCKDCNSKKNSISKDMIEKLYHLLFSPEKSGLGSATAN